METLKYTVINTISQYNDYCTQLELLVEKKGNNQNVEDEIALLTLLIEKWDADHHPHLQLDPVQLLQSFMQTHQLKSKDLVSILGISKGYISDILHYKKGFSKIIIRKLAAYFKVNQEAFNRAYPLAVPQNKQLATA
jgi:HTH-type transcriptional regulator/antitoxin HigA